MKRFTAYGEYSVVFSELVVTNVTKINLNFTSIVYSIHVPI